jgi:hypothetical protein
MKYLIGAVDTKKTWVVVADSERDALNKVYNAISGVPFAALHCISCMHSSTELKSNNMAKKYKSKSKTSRKMLSGYIGQSPWVLTFTTKKGDKFKKKFNSEASLDRAVAGWTAAGGKVRYTPTLFSMVSGSRGIVKRRS